MYLLYERRVDGNKERGRFEMGWIISPVGTNVESGFKRRTREEANQKKGEYMRNEEFCFIKTEKGGERHRVEG